MRSIRGGGLLALAALLLAATGRADIRISGAWVRTTPIGAATAAAYALVENAAALPDRLLGVETDAAEAAELHSMSMDGGMMAMRPAKGGLAVPARGVLKLEPGGFHIMLVRPRAPIRPGDRIVVTLVFERAGRVSVTFPAREQPAGSMPGQGSGARGR